MASGSQEPSPRNVAVALAEALTVNPDQVQVSDPASDSGVDMILQVGKHRFLAQYRSVGSAAAIGTALEALGQAQRSAPGMTPLVVVPYMGEAGRKRCEDAGVAWLDLSGNARIKAPGLVVRLDGRPNRFTRPGRPASVFAPKAARITRELLIHAGQDLTQGELAEVTGMDKGYTSRLVRRLERDHLIVRAEPGRFRASDPSLLLDAWREDYAFSKHAILRGHVPARSGEDLLRRLGEQLREHGIACAATGLGAAWLYTRFAAFRTVTWYLEEEPSSELLQAISFTEEPRGANVWLAVPNDEGVFHGAQDVDGIRCVHPVQVYLDLQGHPERAGEAAARLREELLTWRPRA